MSQGLINANMLEAKSLAVDWLVGRDLRISQESFSPGHDSAASDSCIKGVGASCLAAISFRSEDRGCVAEIRVRPRLHWTMVLFGILFVLLGWSFVLIYQLLREWTLSETFWLMLCVILVISLMHWKDNRLSGKLARIELSFWDLAKSRYDIQRQTRADGQINRRRSRAVIELVFTGYLVVLGGMFLGGWGVVLILVLCVPILVMIVTDISWGDDPAWHWRLWIMGNMGRWTFLMLAIFGVAAILIALEMFMTLEMYKDPDSWSPRQAIAECQFRDIPPATAERLETDIKGHLWNMSASKPADGAQGRQRVRFLGNSIFIFLVIIVSIVGFVLIPFRGLLRSQGRWGSEVGEMEARDGPCVPYLPKAWNWHPPRLLRGVILFHSIFGCLIHVAATVFCIEGISYAFLGRAILWDQIANLWSWVFAVSKILLGDSFGWRVGLILVVVTSSPVLMMLGTFTRRMILNVLLIGRFRLIRQGNSKDFTQSFDQIERFIEVACLREHVRRPILRLTSCDDIVIRLRGMLLSKAAVLEISRGAVDLLDGAELQAVVAHEVGHLSQGIGRVGALKLLSSLALFPNHYLTLCLNWPASEIKADRFALAKTGNPEALQRAIVKISIAQLNYLRSNVSRRSADRAKMNGIKGGVLRRTRGALRIDYASIRFFFGDRLFGYAHPYVSERLEAIAVFHQENVNESE